MKISQNFTSQKIYNINNFATNPYRQQFQGLFKKDKDEFSSSSIPQILKNPVTQVFDTDYTELYQLLERCRIDDYKEIAFASVDSKTGKVAKSSINTLINLIYIKSSDNPMYNIMFKLQRLRTDLLSGLNVKKISGYVPHQTSILRALNSFKDIDGSFSIDNEKFFYKVIRTAAKAPNREEVIALDDVSGIVEMCKDNQTGVVDKHRKDLALKVLKVVKSYAIANYFLSDYFSRDEQISNKIYETIMDEFSGSEISKYSSFPTYANYCFDENGDKIPSMADYANRLAQKSDSAYCDDYFELALKGREYEDFVMENIVGVDNHLYEAYYANLFFNCFANGVDTNSQIQLLLKYKDVRGTFRDIDKLVQLCSKSEDENDYSEEKDRYIFQQEDFDKVLTFWKLQKQFSPDIDVSADPVYDIVTNQFRPELLPYDYKVFLLETLELINENVKDLENIDDFIANDEFALLKDSIESALSSLKSVLYKDDISVSIGTDTKYNFIKEILSSKENQYSDFEKCLVNSIPYLETLVDGIPLKYSREEFCFDINALLKNDSNFEEYLLKAGMNDIIYSQNGDLVGYNGILKPDNLDLSNPIEKELAGIIDKFIFQNKTKTDNEELNHYLDAIFVAIPEFLNVVQKKQHPTQKYSVDVHMLLAMAYCIQNSEYMNLSQNEKSFLKFSALLHDIAKKGDIVDHGHQYLSSEYVDSIASKFFREESVKNRIVEFICSHHWLAQYNTNALDAKNTAIQFRKFNDFDMAKIMAEADLKAVRPEFYQRYAYALSQNNLEPIETALQALDATSNVYFIDRFVNKKLLNQNVQNFNGTDFIVVDLKDVGDDEDVSKFGFRYGTKKSDLKFCVHMIEDSNINLNLNTVKNLTKPSNAGVLSTSIITPKSNRTYRNRKNGLMLAVPTFNILVAHPSNLHSGYRKDLVNVMEQMCSEDGVLCRNRSNFRWALFEELNIEDNNDNIYSYSKFFHDNLSKLTSLSQIDPNKIFKIADREFSGQTLIDVLNKIQNNLIDSRDEVHNEVLVYLPKIEAIISKEPDLASIPVELLNFANENNLPIVLI